MVLLQRKLYFSKDPEGGGGFNIFQGVQLFPGGFQILISIETHINCDFPGVGWSGPPIPPLDPHMTLINILSKR